MLLPPSSSAPQPFTPSSTDLARDLELGPPPLPGTQAKAEGTQAKAEESSRARLVSQAGPSRPVPRSDVAATGWGTAQPNRSPKGGPPPLPPGGGPPPLPSKAKKPRPAHLLLAELEARSQRETPSQDLSLDMPALEIARARVQKPEVPKARRGPSDGAIRTVAALIVALGFFAVYWSTQSEPEPEVKVDAALQAEADRRRQAIELLEKGHILAVEGPERADQAIAAYEQALALVPDLASAEKGLAVAFAAKDQDDVAVQHYRRYLELAPAADDADQVKAIIREYERARRRKR